MPFAARKHGRLIALIGVALVFTVGGASLLAGRLREAPTPLSSSATLAGVNATLHEAGWVSMEAHTMDAQGGYQMPAQMMPGAPAGDEMRLGIPVTLENTSGEPQRFSLADEFSLVGGATRAPVPLHSDTFGQLSRLNPGSAVNGVLYFDTIVPAAGSLPLVLRWNRGGDVVSLEIPTIGTGAQNHPHGS